MLRRQVFVGSVVFTVATGKRIVLVALVGYYDEEVGGRRFSSTAFFCQTSKGRRRPRYASAVEMAFRFVLSGFGSTETRRAGDWWLGAWDWKLRQYICMDTAPTPCCPVLYDSGIYLMMIDRHVASTCDAILRPFNSCIMHLRAVASLPGRLTWPPPSRCPNPKAQATPKNSQL